MHKELKLKWYECIRLRRKQPVNEAPPNVDDFLHQLLTIFGYPIVEGKDLDVNRLAYFSIYFFYLSAAVLRLHLSITQ